MSLSQRPLLLGTTALVAVTLIGTIAAKAADFTWAGGNDASWAVTGSWEEGAIPTSSDTAIFPGPSGNYYVDLGGSTRPVGSLRFLNNTGSIYWIVNGVLALSSGSTVVAAGPIAQGGYTRFQRNATLMLGGDVNFNMAAGADSGLRIEGTISGSGSLIKSGAGQLDLSGTASMSGGLRITDGTVLLSGTNVLQGASSLTMSAGALELSGNSQQVSSISGTGGTILGGGTAGSSPTLTVGDGTSTTFAGSFQDGGGKLGLTKVGSGTLSLTGSDNTYSGPTAIIGGTLESGVGGFLSAASDFTVNNGATLNIAFGDQEIGSLAGSGTVMIASGTSLTAGLNERATTFSGAFTGDGDLTIEGDATEMTLTGNSEIGGDLTVCCALLDIKGTFSTMGTAAVLGGNLTVSGSMGNLVADVVAVQGGTVNVTGAGRVDTNLLGSIGGDINVSGNGSLITADQVDLMAIAGDARLNISNGGRVATTGDAALSTIAFGDASATIQGTSSEWSVGGNLIVGDTISGTPTPGSLTVSNGGRVSAGTLTIGEEGVVLVGTSGASGIIATSSLVNNGTLAFNHSDALTFSAPISGGGALTKTGSGTLTLTGANTSTGPVTISGGTLVGNAASLGNGTITNNARLVVDQATSASFDTVMVGAGTLFKQGNGRLDLGGTHAFSGATQVQAGNLAVNGSLAQSVVTVANTAILSGTGTVGGILAQSGSTVAPGNSIGTLNVSGNVSFGAGSIYAVEIDAAGRSDRIAATGNAALSGGTVLIRPDQGTGYVADNPYTILSASSVTGQFAGTTGGEFAFVTPTLGYAHDAVTLTLVRKVVPPTPPEPPNPPEPPRPPKPPEPPAPPTPIAFNSVAVTKNQYRTANGVDALGAGNNLYDTVLGASVAGARQAFNALSGEVHASAVTVAYGDGRIVRESILSRLRRPMAPSLPAFAQGPYSAAYAVDLPSGAPQPVAVAPTFDPHRFTIWGDGFGSWGRVRSNRNAASMDSSIGGFIIGADAQLDPAFRLGMAGGFTRTSFDIDGRLSSGSNESIFGALYGSANWDAINLRLGASYASHDVDVSRMVLFPGFSDATSASYDGSTLQAFGEVGYGLLLGAARIEPFVSASILRLHTDRFQESGGAAALSGDSRTYDLGTTTLGVRADARINDEVPLTLRGMLGWRRAYGDVEPDALLAFASGASAFTVSGVPVDRNALIVEAGLDWQATSDLSLGVVYSGQIGDRAQDHVVKGNFTWHFETR